MERSPQDLNSNFEPSHGEDPSATQDRNENDTKTPFSSEASSRVFKLMNDMPFSNTAPASRSPSPSPPASQHMHIENADLSKTESLSRERRNSRRRSGVSAECTSIEDIALFKPKVIIKTKDAKDRIQQALHKSPLLKSLDKEQVQIVIDAVEEVKYASGDVIIKQGDLGDRFYLLEEGTCEVWIKEDLDEEERIVKTYNAGDSFGELALLYDAPRAATVKAISDCVLWAVDRITFRTIVMSTTKKKRELYEQFLQDVPILKTLQKYERSTIADVLEAEYFNEGEDIIIEGEPGNKMYFLEDGEAEATSNGNVVMKYKRADYFGELALLNDKPRAATITALTPCKCASIDRESFKRLLGKVEDIMNRKRSIYGGFKDGNDDDEHHQSWE